MLSVHAAHSENKQFHRRGEEEMTNHNPPFCDLWSSLQHHPLQNHLISISHCHQQHRQSFCISSSTNIRLDLCTESLGSETGTHMEDAISSLFHHHQTPDNSSPAPQSSPPASPVLTKRRNRSFRRQERMRKGLPTFPPPLASCSHQVHVSSHREDGRLVLRAITLPTRKYLEAERINGRLRLRLLYPTSSVKNDDVDREKEDEDEAEEQEEEGKGFQEEDGREGYEVIEGEEHELVLRHCQPSAAKHSCTMVKRLHRAGASFFVNHHHFVISPSPRRWNNPVTSSSAFLLPTRSRHSTLFPTRRPSLVVAAEDNKGDDRRRGASHALCGLEEAESAPGLTHPEQMMSLTLGGGSCTEESRQAPAFLIWEPPFCILTTS